MESKRNGWSGPKDFGAGRNGEVTHLMSSFVYVCCQVGAEKALKRDLAAHHPELCFAFSRPSFLTFKVNGAFDANQPLKSVFARASGVSVGSIRSEAKPKSATPRDNSPAQDKPQAEPLVATDDQLAKIVELLPSQAYQHLHVWHRDKGVPGERKFEPYHLPESLEFGKQIKAYAASAESSQAAENIAVTSLAKAPINRTCKQDDVVADIIIVEPNNWFVGWHKATTVSSRWPGGVPPLRPKVEMISRAYLKMQEALRWSQLPITPGDLCVELGSSPGGSVLALLERDLKVIGIDPALMDPRVKDHENFTHLRARAADLKRKEFAEARWLFSDANLAPISTLDAIEDIVTNDQVNIQGLLITIKLLTEEMANEVDGYLERVRNWGYRHVRARQLAFNRKEICVFAAKSRGRMRFVRKRNAPKPNPPEAPNP